jgi:DNA repair exonuclease SbcCD nuclease subunit
MSDLLLAGDLQMKRENLPECASLFEQVESLAKEKNVNTVVWLGDMLDRRGLVEAECLNALFNYFSSSQLNHNIIVGNHDLLSIHSTQSALEPLKALPNVNIYDKPGQIGNVLILPYSRNPKNFLDAIELWVSRLPKDPILLCHQGIKEFTIGSGYTEDEAVNVSDLEAFKLVVAGHYHTPMNKANVVYLGSPFSHSFGESNEEKHLGILNTDTCAIEYVATNMRQHYTHEVSLDFQDPEYFNNLDMKDLHRFILSGTEEQIKEFQKNHQPISGIKYIYRQQGDSNNVAISETLTNHDKWIKWAKDIKQLDKAIVEAGLELLE